MISTYGPKSILKKKKKSNYVIIFLIFIEKGGFLIFTLVHLGKVGQFWQNGGGGLGANLEGLGERIELRTLEDWIWKDDDDVGIDKMAERRVRGHQRSRIPELQGKGKGITQGITEQYSRRTSISPQQLGLAA